VSEAMQSEEQKLHPALKQFHPKKKEQKVQEYPKPSREEVLANRKERKSSRKKERRLARERAHNLRVARRDERKGKK